MNDHHVDCKACGLDRIYDRAPKSWPCCPQCGSDLNQQVLREQRRLVQDRALGRALGRL